MKVVIVPVSNVDGKLVRVRSCIGIVLINGFSLKFISEYSPLTFTLKRLFSGVTLNGSCAVPVISADVAFAVIVKRYGVVPEVSTAGVASSIDSSNLMSKNTASSFSVSEPFQVGFMNISIVPSSLLKLFLVTLY